MKNAVQLAAATIWPELYDDESKAAFDRAATMSGQAASERAEAERRVRRMFDVLGMPPGLDALRGSRLIVDRFRQEDLAAFSCVCAAIAHEST